MKPGQWLQPRHDSHEVFEKDFPKLETSSLEVGCPGCKDFIRLNRRAPTGKIGGWCKRCNRGVGT